MDKTYKEFKELFGDSERPDVAAIDFAYNKAIKKLNRLQAFEENLVIFLIYLLVFQILNFILFEHLLRTF